VLQKLGDVDRALASVPGRATVLQPPHREAIVVAALGRLRRCGHLGGLGELTLRH